MNLFRTAALVAGIMALALLPQREARAQAACPITAPHTTSVTTYNLTNNDQCGGLIFTGGAMATVTLPAATTVAPGFQVLIFAANAGVVITPPSGTMVNNGTSSLVVGQGQSGLLYGDGANYWWAAGSGFIAKAAAVSGFATPGTNWSNSPVYPFPNGVLQLTNPASIIPATNGDAFKVCNGSSNGLLGPPGNISRGAPSWWQIIDPFNRAWRIPLCP